MNVVPVNIFNYRASPGDQRQLVMHSVNCRQNRQQTLAKAAEHSVTCKRCYSQSVNRNRQDFIPRTFPTYYLERDSPKKIYCVINIDSVHTYNQIVNYILSPKELNRLIITTKISLNPNCRVHLHFI